MLSFSIQLKPYVSYKAPYVIGKPLTAKDILALYDQTNTVQE